MARMRNLIPLSLVSVAVAIPAPVPAPTARRVAAAIPQSPMVTPPPALVERNPDFGDSVGSYINSVLTGLGSDVSSFIASGVPQFFQDFPTGSSVESRLGVSDSDLAAKPTQVLNVP
jgi:hypothetical protein